VLLQNRLHQMQVSASSLKAAQAESATHRWVQEPTTAAPQSLSGAFVLTLDDAALLASD